jgi:hypothetical protein
MSETETPQGTEIDQASGGRARYENYLAYVPVAASALALAYDTGQLTVEAPDFFTLFSLSEHIVFAIQVLPLAFMVILMLVALSEAGMVRSGLDMLRRRPLLRTSLGLLAVIITVIAVVVPPYSFGRVFLVGTVAVTIVSILLVAQLPRPRPAMLVAWFSAILFLISFALGANVKAISRQMVETLDLVDGSNIRGKIIRAGENGILVFDVPENELRFVRWDTIKSIHAPVMWRR